MIDTLETNDMLKMTKRDTGDEKSVPKTQRKDYNFECSILYDHKID